MSEIFRNFWKDVVVIDKPLWKRPAGDGAAKTPAAPPQKKPQPGEQQANDPALKALVMKRLIGLAEPFQQAVALKGPNVRELHTLFGTIKTQVGQQDFSAAGSALGTLEQLLAQPPGTASAADQDVADLEKLVATPSGRQVGEAGPEKVAFAGAPVGALGGLAPSVNDLVCNIEINNKTDRDLKLDPSSLNVTGKLGHYTKPPRDVAAHTQKTFVAINDATPLVNIDPRGVDLKITYFLDDDKKTKWTLHFTNGGGITSLLGHIKPNDNTADAKLEPDQGLFDSDADPGDVKADNNTYTFVLTPKGGPGPQPPGPQPPGPGPAPTPAVNASCLITITNNTNVALTLAKDPENEIGDFVDQPPKSLPPGDSRTFAYAHDKSKAAGCKGAVTYNVGSPPAAVWRCEWYNPTGDKNDAHGTADPQTAGFQSVATKGSGDENVPFTFTLSGGGVGPTPPGPGPNPPGPGPNPPGPGPNPPGPDPGKEPDFIPPEKATDPTLRLGDKSADGWVEYLQQLLNVSLTPSPNLKVDGNFGQATHKAVLAYQKQNGIQADGIVGNQTWAQLRGGTATPPSSDGRQPHTFIDKGAKARWFWEAEVAQYDKNSDKMTLMLCSVGDADLKGAKVTVRVTAPGSKAKVKQVLIGDAKERTPDDQGDTYEATVDNFKTNFPSNPAGAKSAEYFVEAYFDKSEGGDFWQGKIAGDD